ncbi:MAG TPA: response regulator [Anaerolineaceae bacterium]|nr:response regulator [Anaerolineaceae bacterium]
MARILFIDDDVLTLNLMGRVTELLGHEALLSSSAASALEMAAQENPSLIMVDLSLPDRDGIEVIQALRQSPATANTPVFVLSAGIASKTAEAAKVAGAEGCLEKPLSLDVLSRVIKNYIRN